LVKKLWKVKFKKGFEHFAKPSHQKREIVMKLIKNYPAQRVCKALDFPRSSFYYQGEEPDETVLKKAIDELATEWPTYGYCRITAMLQRQDWCVNRKRVPRLMREMGLLRAPKPKMQRTTDSRPAAPLNLFMERFEYEVELQIREG